MNTKITVANTNRYDESLPRCGFNDSWDDVTIVLGECYDFEDYLSDRDIMFEVEGDVYYVLGNAGQRTGEAYMITNSEPTDEDPRDWE
jgi:hypothetical protein